MNIQTFCSFLAVIGKQADTGQFERLLAHLPRYRTSAMQFSAPGLRLVVFAPEENPLHECFFLHEGSMVLLLQGDFYRAVPQDALQSLVSNPTLDPTLIGKVLTSLNGAFNGFIANLETGTCVAFTDQFGFNFLYYAHEQGQTWLSSSLWPLLRLNPEQARISQESIQDIALLGYPTADRTILEHVFTIQPGRLVEIGTGATRTHSYAPAPRRHAQSMEAALEQFTRAFRDHFTYVTGRVPRERFVATITGGHDTRVVLNAFLKSDITPTCLTGTGFPTLVTEDAMRAMTVARWAGCPREMLDYTRPNAVIDADAFFMSEGGGTGLWMANLALDGRRYGDVLYCGFSGDVLSGSPEAVNPRLHQRVETLAREVFLSNYEYHNDPQALCQGMLGVRFDDVIARYTQTFEGTQSADLHDSYQSQNIDNRNFRRIGYFANAAKIGLPSVSLFHDQAIARAYMELPYDLLINEKLHRRLCYIANPSLAWIPANPWHVPMWLEPVLWNYVRSPAKKAVRWMRLLQNARVRKRVAQEPGEVVALDERYQPTLALLERANVLDTRVVQQFLASENYDDRGHILAFRLDLIAKLVLFARGEQLVESSQTRLFPDVQEFQPLAQLRVTSYELRV